MFLGSLQIKLYIPQVQSLKEKRSILKRLLAQIQNKFKLSVAELDFQEIWQTALIGIAFIANDKIVIERQKEKLIKFLDQNPGFEVIDIQYEIY